MRLFVYLIVLLPQILLSQNTFFDVKHFSIKDGLPDHQTLLVEQDNNGCIWGNSIGVLYRYDGSYFKVYRKELLEVSGQGFVNFVIDDEDLIWFFEFNEASLKVKILDSQTDKVVSLEDFFEKKLPFPSENIIKLYSDKQFGIVIITNSNGFYSYKNGQLKLLYKTHSLLAYSKLIKDENNNIHFSHKDTLFKITPKGKVDFKIGKDFIIDILSIDNSLYIKYGDFSATEEKLKFSEVVNYLDKRKPKYERIQGEPIDWLEKGNENAAYYFPTIDKKKYKWIIKKTETGTSLVGQSPDNQILFNRSILLNEPKFDIENKHQPSDLRELFVDKQNNIWVTSDHGLYKVSNHVLPFKTYLKNQSIRGMFRQNDQLIVNHGNESVVDLKTNKSTHLDLPLKRLTFFKDKSKLWVGTEYGLTYWNETWNKVNWNTTDWKNSNFYSKELKGYQHIVPYRSKSTNRLWLGTSKGLAYLNPKTKKIEAFNTQNKDLNTSTIRYLYENKNGIWLVTNQGIFVLNEDKETIKDISYKNNFPTSDFYHLHEDSKGIFWFGSSDMGLIRWNLRTNEQQIFGREQGFLNQNIYAVYEDEYGYLWLPSDYGLIRFNKSNYDIYTYLTEHGLR